VRTNAQIILYIFLFIASILSITLPFLWLSNRIGSHIYTLDNRLDILDVGVSDLYRTNDTLLAKLSDVTFALKENITQIKKLKTDLEKISVCDCNKKTNQRNELNNK
jgi:hypothetical protein